MSRAVVIVIGLLMGCSLLLVYSQQRTRILFMEKNRFESQERKLNQEWSRLEYEQRELSNHFQKLKSFGSHQLVRLDNGK